VQVEIRHDRLVTSLPARCENEQERLS
jgi:hypothetical protein